MNRREKGAVRSGVQLCTRTQNRRSFVPICLAFSFGGLSLNVPFGLWSVDRLFPQFNASQPSRPTVTGGTRFGMESTGTTRQCYRVFDGRIDALRFQDAPSILRAASLSYTARGTFLAFAARKAVSSENSDPFHSGNSEPSGNSRKG